MFRNLSLKLNVRFDFPWLPKIALKSCKSPLIAHISYYNCFHAVMVFITEPIYKL